MDIFGAKMWVQQARSKMAKNDNDIDNEKHFFSENNVYVTLKFNL